MAFVEYLARETWSQFLERTFEVALRTLETDPTGPLGSAADDLRGWLVAGGAPRVREAIRAQTTELRLAPGHRDEISCAVDRLLERHRTRILALIARGTLPATPSTLASALGMHADDIATLLGRVARGEPLVEAELRALGRTDAELATLHATIDAFLARRVRPHGQV
jgi:hypothetical protein